MPKKKRTKKEKRNESYKTILPAQGRDAAVRRFIATVNRFHPRAGVGYLVCSKDPGSPFKPNSLTKQRVTHDTVGICFIAGEKGGRTLATLCLNQPAVSSAT